MMIISWNLHTCVLFSVISSTGTYGICAGGKELSDVSITLTLINVCDSW